MKKIFEKLPVLQTERLTLRPVDDNDYKDIFEYASDAETSKYTSWDAHKTIEDSKTLVRFIKKRYSQNKPSNWAVVLKAENKMIGTCGFLSMLEANKRAEIGFVIGKRYWNKGYTTEAVKKTIEFGFKELGLNRIEAYCDTENKASARVLEKSAMKFEGVLRQYVVKGGKFRDVKSYAILAGEFFEGGKSSIAEE